MAWTHDDLVRLRTSLNTLDIYVIDRTKCISRLCTYMPTHRNMCSEYVCIYVRRKAADANQTKGTTTLCTQHPPTLGGGVFVFCVTWLFPLGGMQTAEHLHAHRVHCRLRVVHKTNACCQEPPITTTLKEAMARAF